MTTETNTVRILNTVTGAISVVPRSLLGHPVFGKVWVEVKDGVKPYVPELYRPASPEEFVELHPEKVVESIEETD